MLSSLSLRQKQLLSIVFTFLVYTWLINWKAAILLVVAIGFHESSHLWAAKKLKLKTSGFFLMPFMGGAALVNERYKNLGQQAFVVLMGPVGGGLLAVVTMIVFKFTGYEFLGGAAVWMCYLNLFNLLPISFLDGGQLMDTVSYTIGRTVGFVARVISYLVGLVILFKVAPIIAALVLIMGGISIMTEYNNWKAYRNGQLHLCSEDYLHPPKALTRGQLLLTVFGWVATMLILIGVMINITGNPMESINTIFHH